MEKLKELYNDLISRFKYLESEDAIELYGNDLEGRKRENIQIMVAIGEIVIEDIYKTKPESSLILENKRLKEENERLITQYNSLDDFSSNLLKSNQELSLTVEQIKGGFSFICPNCGQEHKLGIEMLVDRNYIDNKHEPTRKL